VRAYGTKGTAGGHVVTKLLRRGRSGLAPEAVEQLLDAVNAVLDGDFGARPDLRPQDPDARELVAGIHQLLSNNQNFAEALERLRRTIGEDGRMTERAHSDGVGPWDRGVRAVNELVDDLVRPTSEVARVITAVAQGDLSQKITVDAKGEILELKNTINTMVDQLSSFADEVTRVAREVGTEGKLGGQARVRGVSGVWRDLTENVNSMGSNLTDQVRSIAQVTTAVAQGDLSQKITVDAKGEILELKSTINTMVDQLSSFADEVTRVAGEVGTEGKLGGQARVKGVSGVWKELTDNVNQLAANLTSQVRNIAQVTTAVAQGDLSQKITVDAKGEILELKSTINTMVDQLSSFADEVTRVAREVGTEGELGGQARVGGVSGVWKELTDNVNQLAANLTSQVRNIAQVTTAVAQGDLSQKITVDVSGEILELKNTINTMVDQLSSFADEVTRVAREVGTEGKLGGQAHVPGVSGIWEDLTDNVNQLAANLTTQVRAIAEVSTAVTRGDLTRSIAVEAQGEVAELKDNLNQMIANLRETTQKNAEQDWLKTNMARIGTLLQGQRDIQTVADLIMSELTPVVSAQHGAFFLAEGAADGIEPSARPRLELIASYGYMERRHVPASFSFGEGLVGQAARERAPILVTDAPADYVKITSGLGESSPVSVVILPILFEGAVLGVIELASLRPFPHVYQQFLEELVETIGVVLNTLQANMRTQALLDESRRLTSELQSQSGELKQQQDELRRANDELQEKAELLAEQKRSVELKNREIEEARSSLQDKAEQLALSSKYKSEFLANMSHELRTPLNSMLLLAKLLAEDTDGSLTPDQVEFARTIHSSGNDLLDLINDILDLSKVEAGRMDVELAPISVSDLATFARRAFAPLAQEKGLAFTVETAEDVPDTIVSDERRLQQILKNLLANAIKFTEAGRVTLSLEVLAGDVTAAGAGDPGPRLAFRVTDTGIGVSEDQRRLIFEAFQQADGSTNRRFGGTGLGLSISRELARLLGGSIGVESELGRGSTFTLYLPLRLPGAAGAAAAGLDTAGARAGGDGDAPLLLVVADDAERRARLRTAAAAAGFHPLLAGDRDETLAVAEAERPAAVVLDLALATTSAHGLLAELRARPALQSSPTVVIGDGQRARVALRAGALSTLAPHADEDALVAALHHLRDYAERRERTILVLDDTPESEVGTARLLEGPDMRLLRAWEATEGLAMLERHRVDGVVVDVDDVRAAATVVSAVTDRAGAPVPVLLHDRSVDGELRAALEAEGPAPPVLTLARSPRELAVEVARRFHRREPAPQEGADGRLAGRRALLVDDDLRNLYALRRALEHHGVELVLAEDGHEALARFEEHDDIDIVVMDLMMPNMDGLATTEAIRARPDGKDVPIIVLTAKAQTDDRLASLAAGASDFVTKPVDVQRLLRLLSVWVADA
jgi:signal transduction histidine kinase/HAMP domain-containing protein/DNA-binding response OmpR family regulator